MLLGELNLCMKSAKIYINYFLQNDSGNRMIRLYENVTRRGPKAYKNLIRALIESENLQAARILEPVHNGSHQTSHVYNGSPSINPGMVSNGNG